MSIELKENKNALSSLTELVTEKEKEKIILEKQCEEKIKGLEEVISKLKEENRELTKASQEKEEQENKRR